MKKYLVLLLFFTLLISEMLGLKLGVSQGLSAKNILLYFLVMLIGFNKMHSDDRAASIKSIHACFLLLIFIAFSSWFLTDIHRPIAPLSTKEDRFFTLKGLLIDHYLFFVVFYYSANTVRDVVFLIKAIVTLIAISTFITIIDVYDIPDLGIIKQMEHSEAGHGRVQGPLGEPNQYAAFLVLFIPLYVAFTKTSKGLFRYFCWFSLLLTSVVLILTGSRGGIFGLLLGTLIGVWMFRRNIGFGQVASYGVKIAAFGSVVIAIALYKYADVILRRVDATTQTGDAVTASAGRLWIWEKGINRMLDEPLSFIVGHGWNTYAGYVGVVSHNSFLTVLFELGLLGLIPFLALVFKIISIARKGAAKSTRENRILIGGFLFGYMGLLVSVCFVNLFSPWFFIWGFIGLMLRFSLLTLSQQDQSTVQKRILPLPRQGKKMPSSLPISN